MNNETKAADSGAIGTGDFTRRTLVRTAAWSVPVISVAAAAPAFAANSNDLSVTAVPVVSDNKYLDVTLTISNPTGGSLSATAVSVTFTAPTGAVFQGAAKLTPPASPLWTVASTTSATFSGSLDNLDSTQVRIRFTFTPNTKPKPGETVTVSGTVRATGFNDANFPISGTY